MSARCERCGKFRADKDWAYVWHGDTHGGDVAECRWCMAPVDAERIFGNGTMTTTPNPTAEQIVRATLLRCQFDTLGDKVADVVKDLRAHGLLSEGAPQTVIDEAALTGVVFNAVEKWADMYPTPQVSEMIASALCEAYTEGKLT